MEDPVHQLPCSNCAARFVETQTADVSSSRVYQLHYLNHRQGYRSRSSQHGWKCKVAVTGSQAPTDSLSR